MIRPFTAICMSAAFASGLFLYQTKHQAQMLDRQIMGVLKQTEAARERIGVMKAEWALLNEPERLADLSQKHLGLRMLTPAQFVSVADLGSRLPAPATPGTAPSATDEAAAEPAPAAPLPVAASVPVAAAARLAARVAPAAPALAPVQVASAAARPHAPPEHHVEPAAARAAPAAAVQVAALPAAPPAVPAPATHRPLAPVVSIGATPIQPLRPPVPASASGRSAVDSPARDGGLRGSPAVLASSPPSTAYQPAAAYQSALGGFRQALPPPVPYGASQAR